MRRPLIGLATGTNKEETYLLVNNGYMKALEAVGALPVVLPLTDDADVLAACVEQMDGILITGGGDIDPINYGEYARPACGPVEPVRDAMELPLARLLAARTDKPTLGICRGCQSLNVALGGTMYQDLPTDRPQSNIAHSQKQPHRYPAHPVAVTPGSLLAEIAGNESVMVNSLHHQAIRDVAPGLVVCATAPDGLVEAISLAGHPFYLGVQWHPERMWQNDEVSMNIFRAFAAACKIRS